MAKQGMARPDWTQPQPKNEQQPVPEIQGKKTKQNAQPIIAGADSKEQKVFHKQG